MADKILDNLFRLFMKEPSLNEDRMYEKPTRLRSILEPEMAQQMRSHNMEQADYNRQMSALGNAGIGQGMLPAVMAPDVSAGEQLVAMSRAAEMIKRGMHNIPEGTAAVSMFPGQEGRTVQHTRGRTIEGIDPITSMPTSRFEAPQLIQGAPIDRDARAARVMQNAGTFDASAPSGGAPNPELGTKLEQQNTHVQKLKALADTIQAEGLVGGVAAGAQELGKNSINMSFDPASLITGAARKPADAIIGGLFGSQGQARAEAGWDRMEQAVRSAPNVLATHAETLAQKAYPLDEAVDEEAIAEKKKMLAESKRKKAGEAFDKRQREDRFEEEMKKAYRDRQNAGPSYRNLLQESAHLNGQTGAITPEAAQATMLQVIAPELFDPRRIR